MYRQIMYEKYLSSVDVSEEQLDINFNQNVNFQKEIEVNLPEDKKSKILDLGCGYGSFLNALSILGYENIYGVEVGKEQNDFLSKKGIVVYDQNLVDFLKNCNDQFDCITLFDVLEHFKKDEVVEIVSLLKDRLSKDGVLIVRVPNGEAVFKGSIMYGDFTHETFFTKRSMVQLFKTFDFNIVEVFPVYSFGSTIKARLAKVVYLGYVVFYKILLLIDNSASIEYFVATQNILGIIRR